MTPQTFERNLCAGDPRIRVVAPRVLRRVIRGCRQGSGFGFQLPARRVFVIDRERLLSLVAPRELSPPEPEAASTLPAQIFLIGRPDPVELARMQPDERALLAWRLVFEARVEAALRARALGPAAIRERFALLGQVETDEVRAVLDQERLLLPPGDDVQLYEAFAIFYLELRYFEPAGLSRFFPSLEFLDAVDALLARDLDARALLAASRPPGAPDPFAEREPSLIFGPAAVAVLPSPGQLEAVVAEAKAAARAGNAARAAIQFALAARCAPIPSASREGSAGAAAGAERDAQLDALSGRLAQAFDDEPPADAWTEALRPLLAPATDGHWSQEARLLYDLQKLCVERERARFRLDPLRWMATLGRRALRRPLPNQQLVLEVKHLRSARGRLSSAHLLADERARLESLLNRAEATLERALRDRMRSPVAETLDAIGLAPRNLPERVARNKLAAEILDRAVERGFLAIGDLRDAISRNDLKLGDLRARELIHGDALLRADRGLARALEGIYRPGEVYLRWLQRLSSLAFGTRVGRALTRYVALPFGGSFVLLEGLQHIFGPLLGMAGVSLPRLLSAFSLIAVGCALFGLIHSAPIRAGAIWVARRAGRAIRAIVYDAPRWLLTRPALRALLATAPVRLAWRFALAPALLCALLWAVVGAAAGDAGGAVLPMRALIPVGVCVFLLVNVLLNSRVGRDAQEIAADAVARGWQRLRGRIIPGLVRLVLELFRRMLSGFESLLYSVDERLRFKQGQSTLTLIGKAAFGVVWSIITYIARLYITLLVEPQVNPIKHFPVVTVSHKIILPFSLQLTAMTTAWLTPLLGVVAAGAVVGTTVFLLPGVFGFLVWELKENWKLYDANRSRALHALQIGGHGETVLRFMRPGFHSGTLPKLHAKIRTAERRALRRGRWRRSRKLRTEQHHIQETIRAFVQREWVALVAHSPAWGGAPLSVGGVDLGSNRIRVALRREPGEPPLYVSFEEQTGLLVAGVASVGWLPAVDERARAAVRNALIGLYARAGVDLCREQIAALLPRDCAYDVRDEGLVFWPAQDFGVEVCYAIHGEARTLAPRVTEGELGALAPPTLNRGALYVSEHPVLWSEWVAAWQSDAPPRLLPSHRVLPAALGRRAQGAGVQSDSTPEA